MERRHGGEQAIIGAERALPIAEVSSEQHVAVSELHALGARRGARREDDHGGIERRELAWMIELIRLSGNLGVEIDRVAEQGLAFVMMRHQNARHGIHVLDLCGKRVAPFHIRRHALDVERLAVRLAHHGVDAAFLVNERAFLDHVGHVDRHGDSADLGKRHGNRNAFGRVIELERHPIALTYADGAEIVGGAVDVAIKIAVGEYLLLPRLAHELHEGMLAAVNAQPFPQVAQVVVAYDGGHSSSVRPQ